MSKMLVSVTAVFAALAATPALAQSYTPEFGPANIVNEPALQRSNGTVGRGPNANNYRADGSIYASAPRHHRKHRHHAQN